MLVKFNSVRVLCFNDVKIIPGINDLDENLVADMLDDEIIAAKFDSGELETIDRSDIGASKVKTKKGKSPSGLDVLLAASEKNAAKLAAQTVDLEILEAWASAEKRVSVRKVVKSQISKIKNIEYRGKDAKAKFEKSPEGDEE